MAEATLDQFLDALECVLAVPLDVFEQEPDTATDLLVLGRCTADGYGMARNSETGYTWRPASVGAGVPCPADRREYEYGGETHYIGLCQPETFEPWKAGRR